jgi:hypothetical protein
VEVHLPCPALRTWLPTLLDGRRVAAWDPSDAPRRVRAELRRWPIVDASAELAEFEADALLFGVTLERPHPPEHLLTRLEPGAVIVELAVPRGRLVRDLLGLDQRPYQRAAASQARTLQWLTRGYFGLQQWAPVDPPGVVVTIARVR